MPIIRRQQVSIMDIINPWGALRRAKALIAEGHFRNPKTGRLGRKGVTYK